MRSPIKPYDEDSGDENSHEANQKTQKDGTGPKQDDTKEEEEFKPKFKSEVKEYIAKYNLKGERNVREAAEKPDVNAAKTDADEPTYAMKYYRYYDKSGSMESTNVEIYSPHIQHALRKIVGRYPGQDLNGAVVYLTGASEAQALACFFHHRRELEEHGSGLVDLEARVHVLLAVKFVERELSRTIKRYESHSLVSQNPGMLYHDLWTIFKPGDLAVSGEGPSESILKVVDVQYQQGGGLFGGAPKCEITVESFSYDGESFGYMETTFEIDQYSATVEVQKLPLIPLQYRSDLEELKTKLSARGRKFCSLVGAQYRMYKGKALAVEVERVSGFLGLTRNEFPETRLDLDSRVMIDSLAFTENMTSQGLAVGKQRTVNPNDISEEDYLMANCQVAGFALIEKRWCRFYVDYISDIKFDGNAFTSLILPDEKKRLVRALTKQHTMGKDDFDDLITNKGKGCIFLLHGPPGVGKTATAEGVADDIERPIYVMMAGDLGANVDKVETKLKQVLKLVTRWRAVLLIDEADVFLEERSSRDLVRNSLVSSEYSLSTLVNTAFTNCSVVFLRVLEYFSGIMFLTTNRASSLDPAFQSRIHLTLAYEPLGQGTRKRLWVLFLSRTAGFEREHWTDAMLDVMARFNLNGRQIKNAVRTANALALAEDKQLSMEQIQIVLGSAIESDASLKESERFEVKVSGVAYLRPSDINHE